PDPVVKDPVPVPVKPAPAPAPVAKAPVPAPVKPAPAPAPVAKAPVPAPAPAPVKPAPAPAPVAKAPVPAPAPAPAKPAPAPVVKVAIAQNAPVKVKPSIPKISFPVVVYGRIETCNAVNSYQFDGKKGQKVALDVMAQSLGSALDAVVELLDPSGKTIASNDDRAGCDGPNIGEEVCHSDPNVICELPADGVYTARVFGVSRRGGPEYYYRLRISGPQPNFDVCMIPSRITIRGKNANFKVKVFRWEGFDGEITLRCNGAYAETKFSRKGIIKPTENEVNFSIVLPEKQTEDAFELDMVAEATVNGKKLTRKILPVDDWEQAFIYHHLVPHAKLIAIQK
ncbi:MAG: PPC domain-containing protein, partial [Thermoguttaceae bacterium]|nr:PPC domain-containing protein [Thermoguttaceae bacterium]